MAENIRKSGNVEVKDYENEDFYTLLDPIVDNLSDDVPEAQYNRKSLASLLAQLVQFMEDALGIRALPPKPFPKLPAKLFRDFSSHGAIYQIAVKCHEIRAQKNWKRIEWRNPAFRKEMLDVLATIRQEMLRKGLVRNPRVYVHPTCGEQSSKLKKCVHELQGTTVDSEDAVGVTHIIYPFGEKGDPDDGEHYMRTLSVKGPKAMVHHWYLPDSYDEWIPAAVAPEQAESDRAPKGPWKVYVRWVTDSHKYNEWMNPNDYETEEFIAEQERLEGHGGADGMVGSKRKREGDDAQGTTTKSRMHAELSSWSEILRDGVTCHTVLNPYPKAMDGSASAENITHGQHCAAASTSVTAAAPAVPRAPHPEVLAGSISAEAVQAIAPFEPTKAEYRVPDFSTWFDPCAIHDIERRNVTEFFNGVSTSKTPETYMQYRNFMVQRYKENPARWLSFTECRRLINGDFGGVQKIWQFLDQWGLINHTAKKPQILMLASHIGGGKHGAIGATPSPSASSLMTFHMPSLTDAARAAGSSTTTTVSVTNKTRTPTNHTPPSATQIMCSARPWVDCTALYYHCSKYADVNLCPLSFAEGRFPPGCSSKDFVRMEGIQKAASSSTPEPSGWTDQETLLLLEAIETYGENWTDVAEHVGTKSQVECIMHFLSLPIEEELIEHHDGAAHDDDANYLPFADQANPVISQVAFLAAVIGPKVAAAAAQRALEVLSEVDAAKQTSSTSPTKPANEASAAASNAGAAASMTTTQQQPSSAAMPATTPATMTATTAATPPTNGAAQHTDNPLPHQQQQQQQQQHAAQPLVNGEPCSMAAMPQASASKPSTELNTDNNVRDAPMHAATNAASIAAQRDTQQHSTAAAASLQPHAAAQHTAAVLTPRAEQQPQNVSDAQAVTSTAATVVHGNNEGNAAAAAHASQATTNAHDEAADAAGSAADAPNTATIAAPHAESANPQHDDVSDINAYTPMQVDAQHATAASPSQQQPQTDAMANNGSTAPMVSNAAAAANDAAAAGNHREAAAALHEARDDADNHQMLMSVDVTPATPSSSVPSATVVVVDGSSNAQAATMPPTTDPQSTTANHVPSTTAAPAAQSALPHPIAAAAPAHAAQQLPSQSIQQSMPTAAPLAASAAVQNVAAPFAASTLPAAAVPASAAAMLQQSVAAQPAASSLSSLTAAMPMMMTHDASSLLQRPMFAAAAGTLPMGLSAIAPGAVPPQLQGMAPMFAPAALHPLVQANSAALQQQLALQSATALPQFAVVQKPSAFSADTVRMVCKEAYAAAAVKARLLAETEEREIQRLMVAIIDNQLKKLDAKLKVLNDLDKCFDTEKLAMAQGRKQLDVDVAKLEQLYKQHQSDAHKSTARAAAAFMNGTL